MNATLQIWRARIGYQGCLLACCAALTSAALVGAHALTGPAIAHAAREDLKQSLQQVLPPGLADNDLLADSLSVDDAGTPRTVYLGRNAGVIKAALFEYSGRGYAGEIRLLVGVDPAGQIIGVRVLKHTETPGLGDKIEAARSDWIHAFEHRSLDTPPLARWGVKKDGGEFDQFAGATITPRAVVKAVREALQFYAAHRAQIIGEPRA